MYEYKAIVRRIVDGDTVDCDIDLGLRTWRMNERLRLAKINAPEMRGEEREAGLEAKAWLEAKIPVGTEMVIQTSKDDAFGRWIATIWLFGECVNDAMVEAGKAEYKSY